MTRLRLDGRIDEAEVQEVSQYDYYDATVLGWLARASTG